MTAIASTSGRLHSEFVCVLFLQTHRETDRFFLASGVQIPQPTSGLFHFHRTAFSSRIKSKIGNIVAQAVALRIVLNIDGTPIPSKLESSHTHPSHSQTSRLLTSSLSIFRCSSPPHNPLYARRVDPSVLVLSLSSHRTHI
jgi:hypothetical protein